MKVIQLEIYGQSFPIRADLDPDYLERLARAVDARMQSLAEETGTLDLGRLALLTALNLADQLEQLPQERPIESSPSLSTQLAHRLEQCRHRLEGALADS